MSWKDRIQTASYISPSGIRFDFLYENLSMESDKKTGEFVFPEINGSFIQDLGHTGRRFPFTIFFSGADCDVLADSFFAALEEKGIGTLEHPLYGTRKVIPTGTITRKDDLITAANEVAFTVSFTETIEDITFPVSIVDQKTEITNSLSNLNEKTNSQYSSNISDLGATENALMQVDLQSKKNLIDSSLSDLVALDEDSKSDFEIVGASLEENIGNLITNPDSVCSQFITYINTPANVTASASAKILGYSSAIAGITGSVIDTPGKFYNAFMIIGSLFGSLNYSMLTADFSNRPNALSATDSIINLKDSINTWLDENITTLGIEDTGEIYDSLTDLYSKTIAYLISISFDLPKEIFLTLTDDRNIVELVAELYDDLDKIDFFIQTNNLNSDQIELLPMGTEIVYYE